MKETLCWECNNNSCSWVCDLKPVENWEAEKNKASYIVKNCPKFEKLKKLKEKSKHKVICEIAERYGVSVRTVYRNMPNFRRFMEKYKKER